MTRGTITCIGRFRIRKPGLGKPEPLKWELQGAWSRRIDSANRLVYMIEDGDLCILSVRDHY